MKKVIAIIMGALVVLILAGFVALNIMGAPIDKDDTTPVTVTIETGSGTYQIASVLQENGLIDNVRSFRIVSKFSGNDGDYKAGTYSLARSMSMREMSNIIARGDAEVNEFTIIPGQTVDKVAQALDEQGIVSYDEFIDAQEHHDFDYDFISDNGDKTYRLEGYLMPETYHFDPNADVDTVINAMLSRFDEVVYKGIYEKEKDKNDLSFEQVLTVASIIQREAGNEKDMKKVSSVIYNRLKKDMALQMDSIVSYILKKDVVNLTNQDTRVDSPYNPYDHKGLPPGPICNPSTDAIKAAYEPADTDYLYFVLSEKLDGSAVFSKDYDHFLEEKEKYYDAYNKAHENDQ